MKSNPPTSDADLAGRFAELRDPDDLGVPSFERLLARPRAARRSMHPATRLAIAGIVVALFAWMRFHAAEPPRPIAPSSTKIATWVAPTDFLLTTPGIAIWRSVPTIPESTSLESAADSGAESQAKPREKT